MNYAGICLVTFDCVSGVIRVPLVDDSASRKEFIDLHVRCVRGACEVRARWAETGRGQVGDAPAESSTITVHRHCGMVARG